MILRRIATKLQEIDVIGQRSNSQCNFVYSYVYMPASLLLTALLKKHFVNFQQDQCELEHVSSVTGHIINVMSCSMFKVFAIGFVTNILRFYTNINV